MFVYQPLAMVYDLEQIGYALITGDLESFTPYSDIGLAAWNGAGTIDILVGMLKAIGYVPIEFVRAIESGDPERIGAATLNAALLAYGACKAVGGIRGAFGKGNAANSLGTETEIVQRAMSRAELEATRRTGLLRGGRKGTHHVSDAVNSTAKRARQRLGLPVEPEVRVTMEVPKGRFSPPRRVQPFEVKPGKVLPGRGMERTATGDIPVKILDVWEY